MPKTSPGTRSFSGGEIAGTSKKALRKPSKAPPRAARVKKVSPAPPAPVEAVTDWRAKYKTEPFPSPGVWCSFYYEGGHGERYWSGGWHCGVIREIPIKGQHKNWMRIELMVDHYAVEEDVKTGERVRRLIPHEKPWVFGANVNPLGDNVYHGPRLHEVVAERQEAKEQEQARAEAAKVGKRVRASASRQPKQERPSAPPKVRPRKRQGPRAKRSKAA